MVTKKKATVGPRAKRGVPPAPKREGAAAVDRALAIVVALEAAAQALSLADLARATGLYKSTLLRQLASLERSTLVERRSDNFYALGPLAFRLGRAFEATHNLEEVLMPLMRRLVDAGTESPSFHVWHDEETRLCLYRIDSHHSTLDRVRAGALLPLDRGAAGKVLRAFRSPAARPAELPLIQTSFGERDPACAALAVPVFGAGGTLVGALSVSGPRERYGPEAIERMSSALLEAAAAATRSLGGEWPRRALTRAA